MLYPRERALTVKYEDLLPVQRTSNSLTIGGMILHEGSDNWFVQNSFTKDKGGTLLFYMYTSTNPDNEQ